MNLWSNYTLLPSQPLSEICFHDCRMFNIQVDGETCGAFLPVAPPPVPKRLRCTAGVHAVEHYKGH